MKVDVAKLRKDIKDAIKECKVDLKGLSVYDHDRIDLEGKIYAYEFVRDCLLVPSSNPPRRPK